MNNRKEKTFSEVWGEFITSQTTKGVADITIRNYHHVLHNISKHFDIDTPSFCSIDLTRWLYLLYIFISIQLEKDRNVCYDEAE